MWNSLDFIAVLCGRCIPNRSIYVLKKARKIVGAIPTQVLSRAMYTHEVVFDTIQLAARTDILARCWSRIKPRIG